ncbi:MAG: cadherin-like domain-containing protein, partial [Proteobacteria bacterium]|nr:cadherin-like domain-containing protein [Pseudomonadota bacterium]
MQVDLTGTNDRATISGSIAGAATEDTAKVASGTLNVADADAGEAHTQAASVTDAHGTFAVDTNGHWSYTLNNDSAAVQSLGVNDHLTKTFNVASADGTATQAVTVTVNGSNDAPVLGSVTGGTGTESTSSAATQVTGKVIATDIDTGDTLSYSVAADSQSHHGTLAVDAGGNFVFTATDNNWSGADSFTVQVSDGHGGTVNQTVNINVAGAADQASVSVSIGAGTVSEGGSFTVTNLDGSAGYSNTYGYYVMDDNGNPTSGHVIWANTHADVNQSVTISGVDPDHVGFFIIPDGHQNASLADNTNISFTKDAAGHWQAVDPAGHVLTGSGTNVLFDKGSLNTDGMTHVRDNSVDAGNQDWEDLTGGGDRDFNDVNANVTWNTAATTSSHPLTVAANFPDMDGSEGHAVKISGLPAGATLTQDGVALVPGADGSYSISPTHLTGLAVKTPANFAGDLNVSVTAISTEGTTTASASASTTVHDDLTNHGPTVAANASYND